MTSVVFGYTVQSSIRRAKPASLDAYYLAQLGGKDGSMLKNELSTAANPCASGYAVTRLHPTSLRAGKSK